MEVAREWFEKENTSYANNRISLDLCDCFGAERGLVYWRPDGCYQSWCRGVPNWVISIVCLPRGTKWRIRRGIIGGCLKCSGDLLLVKLDSSPKFKLRHYRMVDDNRHYTH